MRKAAVLIAFCATLSGCITLGPNRFSSPTIVHTPFDVTETKKLLEPGNNSIRGSALVRQQGGGVVTCSGTEVTLFPATPYAVERIRLTFGSDHRAFIPADGYYLAYRFEPDPPEYSTMKRTVVCDAQGAFEFDALADGEYYVTTSIMWKAGNMRQGGVIVQRFKVTGGEAKRVVLTP